MWYHAQNLYSGMQIMTGKPTTMGTLCIHIVLNGVIFPQILYNIAPHAWHFLPVKFFPKYHFHKPQNVIWTDE